MPLKSLDRQLATIFRGCEEYYLTNDSRTERKPGEAYNRMQKALVAVLKAMATIHAELYPGYEPDGDHPGYLIKFEPPIFFRVPITYYLRFPMRTNWKRFGYCRVWSVPVIVR